MKKFFIGYFKYVDDKFTFFDFFMLCNSFLLFAHMIDDIDYDWLFSGFNLIKPLIFAFTFYFVISFFDYLDSYKFNSGKESDVK